jgi:cell division septation protein DedD
MVLESQVQTLGKPSIFTTTPANITSSQKSTGSEPLRYTIQVGAYKTEANASQMASNLLKKGYRTRITPDTKNGAPLFKVHVDKFSSKKQALKLTEKFATEENLPSFVTTTSLN